MGITMSDETFVVAKYYMRSPVRGVMVANAEVVVGSDGLGTNVASADGRRMDGRGKYR